MAQEEKCYEVKKIDGKGLGCFATRDIKIGEVVISDEEPIFCMRNVDVNSRNLDAMQNAIDTITQKELESFQVLACYKDYIKEDKKNDDSSNKRKFVSRMLDIWNTNAIDLDSSQLYSGVFAKISRFNHSCQCNCRYRPNMKNGTMDIVCVYNIPRGNEITVDYCARFVDLHSKRQKLTQYFDCQCVRCSKKNFEKSNEILKQFCELTKTIDKKFDQVSQKGSKDELFSLFENCEKALVIARSDFAPSIQFEALQPIHYQKIVLALKLLSLNDKSIIDFNIDNVKQWIQDYLQREIVMRREIDSIVSQFNVLMDSLTN